MDGEVGAPRRISLFRTLGTYLLVPAWYAVFLALGVLDKPLPREPAGPARWGFYLLLAAIPVVVLALGFWTNREGFRRWTQAQRTSAGGLLALEALGWVGLWFVVGFFGLRLFAPPYGDYTTRAKVSEMLLSLSAVRSEVTQRAERAGSLAGTGKGIAPSPSKWNSFSFVGSDGTALAYNAGFGVLVLIQPSIEAGRISWVCEGYPEREIPSSCRESRTRSTSMDRDAAGSATDHARELYLLAKKLRDKPKPGRLPSAGIMDVGYQDTDGTLVLFSDRHGVLLHMSPDASCVVHPAQARIPGCAPGTTR